MSVRDLAAVLLSAGRFRSAEEDSAWPWCAASPRTSFVTADGADRSKTAPVDVCALSRRFSVMPALSGSRRWAPARKFRRYHRAGHRVAAVGLKRRSSRVKAIVRHGDAGARLFGDLGIDAAQHFAQRVMGVVGAGPDAFDPRDRLVMGACIADAPLQEVLHRAGQGAAYSGVQISIASAAETHPRSSATAPSTGCPSRSSSGLKCGKVAIPPKSTVVTPLGATTPAGLSSAVLVDPRAGCRTPAALAMSLSPSPGYPEPDAPPLPTRS